MTAPSGEQIAASIEALRTDASRWNEMADELRTAASSAAGLGLGPFQFSGLGHLLGIDEIYAELQQHITELLQQGGANFENVAGALRTAADNYEQDEQDNLHRMQGLY